MQIINCTPHEVKLNNGESFPISGNIARVSSSFEATGKGFFKVAYGEVTGLPEAKADTLYIVSAMVANATSRNDVIVPATGHPDTIRNEKGQIVSVPGFIVK